MKIFKLSLCLLMIFSQVQSRQHYQPSSVVASALTNIEFASVAESLELLKSVITTDEFAGILQLIKKHKIDITEKFPKISLNKNVLTGPQKILAYKNSSGQMVVKIGSKTIKRKVGEPIDLFFERLLSAATVSGHKIDDLLLPRAHALVFLLYGGAMLLGLLGALTITFAGLYTVVAVGTLISRAFKMGKIKCEKINQTQFGVKLGANTKKELKFTDAGKRAITELEGMLATKFKDMKPCRQNLKVVKSKAESYAKTPGSPNLRRSPENGVG